ncbi:hypothetical protein NB691_001100 [Xanthomonas sacchari]|nr:hypothetical protein [Xanthomonas sacchari]
MADHQTLLELAEAAVKIARNDLGYGAAGMSAEQELIVVMMAFYETDTH